MVGKIAYRGQMRGVGVLQEVCCIILFVTAAKASNPLGMVTACIAKTLNEAGVGLMLGLWRSRCASP